MIMMILTMMIMIMMMILTMMMIMVMMMILTMIILTLMMMTQIITRPDYLQPLLDLLMREKRHKSPFSQQSAYMWDMLVAVLKYFCGLRTVSLSIGWPLLEVVVIFHLLLLNAHLNGVDLTLCWLLPKCYSPMHPHPQLNEEGLIAPAPQSTESPLLGP